MKEYFYKISIILDKKELDVLNNAISLYKISSSILNYGENIEECEMITDKLNDYEILTKEELEELEK